MTVADEHLTTFIFDLDRWDREDAERGLGPDPDQPACVRDALAVFESLQPIIGIVIKLGGDQTPGESPAGDAEWAAMVALARRDVLVGQARTADRGLTDSSLRLLDRIEEMIGEWGRGWDDQARGRVQSLVSARRCGRQRGQELRKAGQIREPIAPVSRGWLARHPHDHFLRQAIAHVSDQECQTLIRAMIARLTSSYEGLCRLDWTPEEASADAVAEVMVRDDRRGGWSQPVNTHVAVPIKGHATAGAEAKVWLVENPSGPFNGTRVALLTGERWLICAAVLDDGTLLPIDGTRRLAVA